MIHVQQHVKMEVLTEAPGLSRSDVWKEDLEQAVSFQRSPLKTSSLTLKPFTCGYKSVQE